MDNPLVSVVVVTRDRPQLLQQCIKSILENTYKHIQLVIFDNSSLESRRITRNFLSSLKSRSHCDMKYIESPPKGFAEMRQIAVNNSRGEIIMSIDDDCVAGREAISHIVRRFMSDQTIGIVGSNMTNIGFEAQEEFKGRGKIGINGRYELVRDPRDADVFGSANMSIRREAFDAVGGYDSFFSGGLEEADLTLRIKNSGYKVVYEPAARITHFHSPSRFRAKLHNEDVYRLYLFFRHYMPNAWTEWCRFARNETKMLIENVRGLIPKFNLTSIATNVRSYSLVNENEGYPGKYLRAIHYILKMSYYRSYYVATGFPKFMAARFLIPYLVLKARGARLQEKKSA